MAIMYCPEMNSNDLCGKNGNGLLGLRSFEGLLPYSDIAHLLFYYLSFEELFDFVSTFTADVANLDSFLSSGFSILQTVVATKVVSAATVGIIGLYDFTPPPTIAVISTDWCIVGWRGCVDHFCCCFFLQ